MTLTDDRISNVQDEPTSTPPSRRFGLRAWLIAVATVVVVVVLLAFLVGGGGSNNSDTASLGKSAGSGDSSAATTSNASNAAGVAGLKQLAPADASRPAVPGAPAAPGAPTQPIDTVSKVVKTGEMDLTDDKGQVAHTIDRLIALAALERGFVADSHSSEGQSPSGAVTLRVPVQSFEATLTQVRDLPKTKVVSQQTAGEDVTNKYVDQQARVRSLVATRTTYERLLAQANSINDTLAVQSRITDVQTQIEQLQGELRVLGDQTSYGTLAVTVDEGPTKVAPVHHQSGMSEAFHRSLDRFVNGIEAIVGILGPLLLVALLLGLGLAVGSLVYRRVRRQLV
jgi:hypothetical protein